MRKIRLVTLSIILLISLSMVLPVNAAKPMYKARGKVTMYADAWTSEIVSGHWSVTANEEEVTDFKIFYVERNLPGGEEVENSPAGSYDQFWHELLNAYNVQIDGDTLTFDCTMYITKLWTKMDGTKEWYGWESAELHITINEDGFTLDRPPFASTPEQDFDVLGTATHIKY